MPAGENSVGRGLSTAGGKLGMTQCPSADHGIFVKRQGYGTSCHSSQHFCSPAFFGRECCRQASGGTLSNADVNDDPENEDAGEEKEGQEEQEDSN